MTRQDEKNGALHIFIPVFLSFSFLRLCTELEVETSWWHAKCDSWVQDRGGTKCYKASNFLVRYIRTLIVRIILNWIAWIIQLPVISALRKSSTHPIYPLLTVHKIVYNSYVFVTACYRDAVGSKTNSFFVWCVVYTSRGRCGVVTNKNLNRQQTFSVIN